MITAIEIVYFTAAVLFILGLKQMSSPVTARRGIIWAGIGMVVAVLATFLDPTLHGTLNFVLMIIAIGIGGYYAWHTGKTVEMTAMPQMIALYNGMGGGAAAAIAAVELFKAAGSVSELPLVYGDVRAVLGKDVAALAVLGGIIGSVAFSGSLVAWAKLDGRFNRTSIVPSQNLVYIGLIVLTVILGVSTYAAESSSTVLLFFILSLLLGIFIAVPVGGADMPVIIALFNALTGLAVGFEGYVLNNAAMIIAGTVVGSSGTLLTLLMAKAMNRSVANVLIGGFGAPQEGSEAVEIEGSMKEVQAQDAGIMMAYADKVIIVPGYGMAVAQAQHKIWELTQLLEERGVTVKFAIHPVAGRMPGHMNVLLAEAGVPYDKIFDMDEINNEFTSATVSLIIGANDVVNPAAIEDKTSPLYGMPILNAHESQNVIVIKRGQGKGFSGVENLLFYGDSTQMLYGDGQAAAAELIKAIEPL